MKKQYEYIIVGAGVGGAMLARELSLQGAEVMILERGWRHENIGTTLASTRYYDVNSLTKMPTRSKEGVILWRTFMAGGSSMVSCGNATPCLERQLAQLGVDLEADIDTVMKELPISLTDEALLSEGSRCLQDSAAELGYEMKRMPKFLRTELCIRCGRCTLGCEYGARWSALELLDEAITCGSQVMYGVQVKQVLIEDDQAVGVIASGPQGEVRIHAKTIVLAAGGLGSPVILQNSGIDQAGYGLFMDLFINVYGVVNGINQAKEPLMALVLDQYHETEGFIVSPYVNQSRLGRFIELGPEGASLSVRNLLGLMVKTTDEMAGQVFPDGTVSKLVTDADQKRLDAGYAIAEEILINAGADKTRILRSKVQGAHPGGTAAVGKVVNTDLQTRVENLYVCDASVLPEPPGLPPIITILALAKRLSRHFHVRA